MEVDRRLSDLDQTESKLKSRADQLQIEQQSLNLARAEVDERKQTMDDEWAKRQSQLNQQQEELDRQKLALDERELKLRGDREAFDREMDDSKSRSRSVSERNDLRRLRMNRIRKALRARRAEVDKRIEIAEQVRVEAVEIRESVSNTA